MTDPRQLLETVDTIAVVGFSTKPAKAAHAIPMTAIAHGFTVIPVHPTAVAISGRRAYPTLEAIGGPVDLVNVFRPSAEAAHVVRSAVAIGAKAVWLQVGIRSAEARQIAADAGLDYVEDRCLGVDLQRWGIRRREPS